VPEEKKNLSSAQLLLLNARALKNTPLANILSRSIRSFRAHKCVSRAILWNEAVVFLSLHHDDAPLSLSRAKKFPPSFREERH
jgi:hypothetical protein